MARLPSLAERQAQLPGIVDRIKAAGRGKPYDCVIGLSGGVDSTYLAWQVKELGLRPLAVHLDNGWDSELAVMNIANVVNQLGIDLHTHVVDWEEFKDIQLAYFRSSVIDIETPTDHAIWALLYRTASKHGIKFIINGANLATECILPSSWISDKFDLKNLRAIHAAFGSVPMRTLPTLGFVRRHYYRQLMRIKVVMLLDYLPYVKAEAKALIERELGWRDYGGKHHESFFTKFYQAYLLPTKFGVDKRRAHLSTLICSGQLTREAALAELAIPPCPPASAADDLAYILKKWGLTPAQFAEIMARPPKHYTAYPSYHNSWWYILGRRLYRAISPK